MTEIRFAFDVGERVIDTDRDFTTGTWECGPDGFAKKKEQK